MRAAPSVAASVVEHKQLLFVVVDGSSDADGVFTPVLQGSAADRSQWREPTRTSEGLCSLYEAALCLFEEVRLKLGEA